MVIVFLADIPGLIEGAHEGQGLGHEFLRHVERTRVLIHVLDMSGIEREPLEAFHSINNELVKYSERLLEKPQVVAANKMDLPQSQENYNEIKPLLEREGYFVIPVSGATGKGIKELTYYVGDMLKKIPKQPKIEHIKEYKLVEEEPFVIKREGQIYHVSGRRIERLVAMTDMENESAVKRLQRVFKKMGLDDELKANGIKPGDTVIIGESEFYYKE